MRRVLQLPWPDKVLSPNARVHWSKRAEATRNARLHAYIMCSQVGLVRGGKSAKLTFTYHPPNKRRRDAQNVPAMLKAYIDGIADHVGCDDSNFTCMFPGGFDEIREGGEIVVKIEVSE